MKNNPIEISKAISHALRHAPSSYGLTLDEEGFATLDALISGLRIAQKQWHNLDSRVRKKAFVHKNQGTSYVLRCYHLQCFYSKRNGFPKNLAFSIR